MNLSDYVIAGVPLIFVILGTVEWLKKTAIDSKLLPYVSMLVGLVFGVGYQFASVGFPADFAGWFGAAVFGIACGLVASGIYDVGEGLTRK